MSVVEQVVVAPSRFAVRVQPDREVVYVQPDGELDLTTTPQLHDQVQELVEAEFAQLVIDLRELSFIDATGIRLLLSLAEQAHDEGWRLSLIRGSGQVQRICELADPLGRLPLCSAVTLIG